MKPDAEPDASRAHLRSIPTRSPQGQAHHDRRKTGGLDRFAEAQKLPTVPNRIVISAQHNSIRTGLTPHSLGNPCEQLDIGQSVINLIGNTPEHVT